MSELEDIEARMLEIQREYIRKSAGLDASRLRILKNDSATR